MLSETTLGFLSTLTYRGDAKRQVCWLPLSGIYWDDEMPDVGHLTKIPEDDKHQIFRLFSIRVRLWKGEPLLDADSQFWDTTYSQVPSWAFFHRQQISADDLRAQEHAERASTEVFEALIADADEVIVSEKNGVQSFSATFRVTKEKTAEGRKPWWARMFRKRLPES
jgi:hypothetical protein